MRLLMSYLHNFTALLVTIFLFCYPCPANAQITLNQIDTFGSGTTANWTQGGTASGVAVVLGGPAGGADQYLQITSNGVGSATSRLVTFNRTQWIGDYKTAGVTAISLDLRAPISNNQARPIRLAFRDGATGTGYSSNAFSLPNDGLWHHTLFPVTSSNFTAVGSPTPFDTFLTTTTELRVLSAASPSLLGDPIMAIVGVDNIQAGVAPVPEPTLALFALIPLLVASLRIRRSRSAAGQI